MKTFEALVIWKQFKQHYHHYHDNISCTKIQRHFEFEKSRWSNRLNYKILSIKIIKAKRFLLACRILSSGWSVILSFLDSLSILLGIEWKETYTTYNVFWMMVFVLTERSSLFYDMRMWLISISTADNYLSDKANTVHNQTSFQKPSILKALICYKLITPSMFFLSTLLNSKKNSLQF